MKRREINTNIDFEIASPTLKKILIVVVCMLLLFFTVYPAVTLGSSENILKTQTALERTVNKTVDTMAFAIRQEELVDNTVSGTVVPVVKNGTKVSGNDTVANVYSDSNAAQKAARLEELKNEIDYFASVSSYSGTTLQADLSVYKNNVTDAVHALTQAIENNELSEIYTRSRDFREALTKKQTVMGYIPDVSETVSALNAEYESLNNSFNIKASINAQSSGYYVSNADGYENCIDFSTVKKLDCQAVEELLGSSPKTVSSSNVGKLITDFNWYLVLIADKSEIANISTGDTVTVTVTNSAVGDIEMDVVAFNVDEATDKVALILRSNVMNEDIAQLRLASVKLRVGSYSGIAVDNKAMRTVDGEMGVYVKVGNIVKFKKVNLVYSDENLILSGVVKGDSSYLTQYDEIVLEGVELYDSKLLS